MGYGYQSDKYRLPTQVRGDFMSETQEKRKSRILDNNLYIAIWLHSTGEGVISEGQYLGTFSSGNSTVQLLENKPNPTLECLISQLYGYTTGTLTWTGLSNSTIYYLYATIVENASDENPSGDSTREYKSLGTSFNVTGVIPSNSILIAIATTTGSAITINTNPTGKRYIKRVDNHTYHSGLEIAGDVTFNKTVKIDGGLVSGIDIYGDVVITGTENTFTVWSNTTFNRPVTFNDYIIGNPLLVRSGEDIYGNETVRGNLIVQEKIASGIDVFGGDSIIRDDIVLQRTLDVLHGAYLEALTVRSGEDIYGDSIFHDNVTIQNDLKVGGHSSQSGLTIFGNLYITGDGAGGVTSHSLLTDMPSSSNTDHDGRYYKAEDSPNLSGLSIFGDLHVTGGFPVGSDEKVKVTSNDTTPNYLTGKIVAGTNITLTENNNGGNETLTIAATDTTNAPGGNDREVQFNNATAFGGAAGLRYDSTSLVIVNSGLDVTTNSTFRNSVNVQDSLSVEDSSTLKDVTVTALGSLTVNGPTTLTGLTVRSGIDVYGDSTFRDDAIVQKTLGVGGYSSDFYTPKVHILGDTTSVKLLIENTNLDSDSYAELYFKTGNMVRDNSVPVIWAYDLDKSLHFWVKDKDSFLIDGTKVKVFDPLLLHSGLDVYNAGLFRSGLEVQENLVVDKNLTILGNTDLSGLDVFGNTTITGKLNVNGDIDPRNITYSQILKGGEAQLSGLSVFGDLHVVGNSDIGVLNIADMPTGGLWALSSDLNIGNNTLVIDQANNRVGIGTTNPIASLYVQPSATEDEALMLRPKGGLSGYTLTFKLNNTAAYITHDSNIRNLILGTNNRDDLVIDNSGNIGIGTTAQFGDGAGVIGLVNATTNPTSNPTGGGILYSTGGAGTWRGSSGTVTTFGPAEPHCPVCGKDFVWEWQNKKTGHLIVCVWCLTEKLGNIGVIKKEEA